MIAALLPILVWDFAVSDQGCVPKGVGQWAWGVPTSGPSTNAAVWGTRLDGLYFNDATDTLELPVTDVSGLTRPVLVISHWYDILPGDSGIVEVNDGSGWQRVDPVYGYPESAGFEGSSGGFVDTSIDLTGFGAAPGVRFKLATDSTLAAAGWYLADVSLYDGDATPPLLSPLAVPSDTQDLDGPYTFRFSSIDDVGVTAVTVYASVNGGADFSFPATSLAGNEYIAVVPGQSPDSVVRWHAESDDGEQITRYPAVGKASYRVFLAQPRNLRANVGAHDLVDEIRLRWLAPDTPHFIAGYRVDEEDGDSWEVDGTEAWVPVDTSGSHTYTVTAIYNAGPGDASDPLTVDVEVPVLDDVSPRIAYPGDAVQIAVSGTPLYLLEGVSDLDLGPGIKTHEVTVLDVSHLVAQVEVGANAKPGLRDVAVTGTRGTHVFADAFEVGDSADAPHIVSVAPTTLVRGQSVRVTVAASEAFAGDVLIEGDGDLVFNSVDVDGAEVQFGAAASATARLGPHDVVLDDGVRVWTVQLEVTERPTKTVRQCDTTPGAATLAWLPLVVLLRRRRSDA